MQLIEKILTSNSRDFPCKRAGSGEFGDVYKAKWHGSFVSGQLSG